MQDLKRSEASWNVERIVPVPVLVPGFLHAVVIRLPLPPAAAGRTGLIPGRRIKPTSHPSAWPCLAGARGSGEPGSRDISGRSAWAGHRRAQPSCRGSDPSPPSLPSPPFATPKTFSPLAAPSSGYRIGEASRCRLGAQRDSVQAAECPSIGQPCPSHADREAATSPSPSRLPEPPK